MAKTYELGQAYMNRRALPGAGAVALGAAGVGLAVCDDNGESVSAHETETAVPVARPSRSIVAARDAVLLPASVTGTVALTLEAVDVTYEVAAGVQYEAWTLGGTVPSPVLHFRQGDTVNFRLVNNGSAPHPIDFHAAQIDWEVNNRSIPVGESLEFRWTATARRVTLSSRMLDSTRLSRTISRTQNWGLSVCFRG